MTTAFLALLSLIALATSVRGQNAPLGSGLYRSAADFRSHRLTLGVDCKTETHQLRLNEFVGRPYVTVKHGGKAHRVAKKTLFGFRDCEGQSYRFATDYHHLPILNPEEELLLYRVTQLAAGKNPGRANVYFSANAAAPVQALTLLNVKRAFSDNHRFHDLLDAQLGNGDLTAYDETHHMTKINWLLQQTMVVAH